MPVVDPGEGRNEPTGPDSDRPRQVRREPAGDRSIGPEPGEPPDRSLDQRPETDLETRRVPESPPGREPGRPESVPPESEVLSPDTTPGWVGDRLKPAGPGSLEPTDQERVLGRIKKLEE